MSDVRDPERDQVAPTPNDGPSCHDLVMADLEERKQFGLKKYDSLLQPFNGRDFDLDMYEEMLDFLVYHRGRMEEGKERDKEWNTGRWWRVLDKEGNLFLETSNSQEAWDAHEADEGLTVQNLHTRTEKQWRDMT